MKTVVKLYEMNFELSGIRVRVLLKFPELKRIIAGKKFSENGKVIAESETSFEARDNLYYKCGIEI